MLGKSHFLVSSFVIFIYFSIPTHLLSIPLLLYSAFAKFMQTLRFIHPQAAGG